jgi:hypothetical protein
MIRPPFSAICRRHQRAMRMIELHHYDEATRWRILHAVITGKWI